MFIRLIVFIAICASSYQLQADSSKPVYGTMPGLDCVINPYIVVDISSPVAGVIENLYVERSQQVTAGQELAQLESSIERATVDLARYRAGLKSEVGLGTVNVKFDQLRMRRVESLIDEENVSREIVDSVERDSQLSSWNLEQAEENVKIRKLELFKAEELLRQKTLKAPFNGFVLDTFKFRGEYVDDQAILRLAQLDPLVIEAIVPMEHFGSVKPGMYADVMPEVLPNEKLLAKVVAVDRIGDTASSTFGVKLTMPNPDNRIPAGLKCILKFTEMSPDQINDENEKQASRTTDGSLISLLVDSDSQATKKAVSSRSTAGLDTPIVAVASVVALNSTASANTPDSENPDTPVLAAALEAVPSSYIVLIKQPDTNAATQKLVHRLEAAGVSDFMKFSNGTEKRLISLGVYGKLANAANRQVKLAQLGFATFTLELFN
ncbi:MAG: RND family efflux transporter MFP subunit [Granulosicoccus sp.]|jgi:RND family efflux transporter MFP subunit